MEQDDERDAARSSANWLAEGNARYDARDWNEAGIALEGSLALDPRQANAWFRLGNVREELGRDDRVLRESRCHGSVARPDLEQPGKRAAAAATWRPGHRVLPQGHAG